jgi:hypothetical protein
MMGEEQLIKVTDDSCENWTKIAHEKPWASQQSTIIIKLQRQKPTLPPQAEESRLALLFLVCLQSVLRSFQVDVLGRLSS